jgi:hypothetical protein
VNNVFELIKAAGGRTAWSDKHPAYEFLNGPSGTALCRVDPAILTNIVNCNSILPCATPARLALLSADTGPLIWLKDQNTTDAVVAALNDSVTSYDPPNPAHITGILAGSALADFFGVPGSDSRVPDIVITPISGTVYTTSLTKIADHGGFDDDDVHVALLVSNPALPQKTITDEVETRQIACTILKAVSLDCGGLMSQQVEPSKFLPQSSHKNDVTSPSVLYSKGTNR